MDSGARRIVLADGTELVTDEGAGAASGALWCWLHNVTISEAAELFLDPTRTARIRFVYGMYMDVYDGYTEVLTIAKSDRGASVQLTGTDTRIQEHVEADV